MLKTCFPLSVNRSKGYKCLLPPCPSRPYLQLVGVSDGRPGNPTPLCPPHSEVKRSRGELRQAGPGEHRGGADSARRVLMEPWQRPVVATDAQRHVSRLSRCKSP